MIDPSLFLLNLTLFVLAIFLGVELINKVPATLRSWVFKAREDDRPLVITAAAT